MVVFEEIGIGNEVSLNNKMEGKVENKHTNSKVRFDGLRVEQYFKVESIAQSVTRQKGI